MSITTSIILYITIFLLSFLFFFIGERCRDKTKVISILIAISIPAFFAGARSTLVGSDTNGYGVFLFNSCLTSKNGFLKLYETLFAGTDPIELGYVLIQYIVTRFTKNIFWGLFVVSFLTWLFFYLATKILSKKINISIPFTMFLFLIFFYNESLNLMRQSLAAGVMLYALSLFLTNKKIKAIVFAIVGVLFHRMSALMLVLWLIYYVVGLFKKNKKSLKRLYLFITIIGIGILLGIQPITAFLVNKGIASSHYLGYVESGYIAINYGGLLVRLPLACLLAKRYNKFIKGNHILEVFLVMFILELILINAVNLSPWAYRLYGYFLYTKIFLMSINTTNINKVSKNSIRISIYRLLLIGYALIWWFYYTVYLGVNETLPYMFNL